MNEVSGSRRAQLMEEKQTQSQQLPDWDRVIHLSPKLLKDSDAVFKAASEIGKQLGWSMKLVI